MLASKLLCGKVSDVEEIRPGCLNSLGVVGLSCSAVWQLGTVLGWWHLYKKKGDQRVSSYYRGIARLSLTGEAHVRVLERKILFNPGSRVGPLDHWTIFIPSTGCFRVCGSLPKQSTFVSCIWRVHVAAPPVVSCAGCSARMGSRALY